MELMSWDEEKGGGRATRLSTNCANFLILSFIAGLKVKTYFFKNNDAELNKLNIFHNHVILKEIRDV